MAQGNSLIQDFTKGNVSKQLILFSVPFFLANLLQVCYNLADTFFVGQFAGTDTLAAVGVAGMLTSLVLHVCMGFGTGAQIYIAQLVGAGKKDHLPKAISTVVTFGIIIGAVLTAGTIIFTSQIMTAMNTPSDAFSEACIYFIICSAGNLFILMFNIFAGVLRGMGDSRHPMIFVVVGTVVNIVLDYIFIAVFDLHAAGAAAATLIGQIVQLLCTVVFLLKNRESFCFDFRLKSFRIASEHLKNWLRISTPVVLQMTIVGFSLLFVNACINDFGVTEAAVAAVANKVYTIADLVPLAFNSSVSSMAGQCAGAGDTKRISRIFYTAEIMSMCVTVVLASLFLIFPTQIFSVFSSDPAVLEYAGQFMFANAVMSFTASLMSPGIGFMNGVGATMLNMIIGIADGVVGRLTLSIIFGYVLGWGAFGFYTGNALAGFVSVIGTGVYYFFGPWRKRVAKLAQGTKNND